MKRSKRRLTFGKFKGPDFKPQDVRCPVCHGTGQEPSPWESETRRNWSCLGCLGTGKREVFAERLLSGAIQMDERGYPFEPGDHDFDPKKYKSSWDFVQDERV